MRTLRVKTDHVVPVFIHADRHLQFIAISVNKIAFHGSRHVHVQPADFTQSLFYGNALMYELKIIIHVLQITAPATQKHGTFCPRALLGGGQNFLHLSIADIAFYFQYFKPYFFTG